MTALLDLGRADDGHINERLTTEPVIWLAGGGDVVTINGVAELLPPGEPIAADTPAFADKLREGARP